MANKGDLVVNVDKDMEDNMNRVYLVEMMDLVMQVNMKKLWNYKFHLIIGYCFLPSSAQIQPQIRLIWILISIHPTTNPLNWPKGYGGIAKTPSGIILA